MRTFYAVFDTNVLVSALMSKRAERFGRTYCVAL